MKIGRREVGEIVRGCVDTHRYTIRPAIYYMAGHNNISDVVVESQPLIQYDAERLQSSGG